MQEKCCANGCDRPAKYKKHKLCATHYMRYRKNGTIGEAPIHARRVLKPFKVVVQEKSHFIG